MADHDDQTDETEHDHTDEEHVQHTERVQAIFGAAVDKCVEEKLCEAVVYEELVVRAVTEAVVHDITLAEFVANVIETYEALQQDDADLRNVLARTAEKLHHGN